MKTMRNLKSITAVFTIICFALVVYLSACQPDPCVTRNTICKSGGVCKDGDCICAVGFEGDSCQFRANEKFDSYYSVIRTELINGSIPNLNDDTIRIKNKNDPQGLLFYSIRDSIFEVINGSALGNKITIPTQTIQDSTYYGSGSVNDEVITITLFKEWPLGNSSKTTFVGYKFVP
jgi:hypothetical protein